MREGALTPPDASYFPLCPTAKGGYQERAHSWVFEITDDSLSDLFRSDTTLDLRPDVVLMDLTMPGVGGLEATRRIVMDWPSAKVVVLTAFADLRLVRDAFTAGARGYVLKDADPSVVVEAVREAARGGRPLSVSISED